MKKIGLLLAVAYSLVHHAYANLTLHQLQVGYQTMLIDTDPATPQFSWQMRAT